MRWLCLTLALAALTGCGGDDGSGDSSAAGDGAAGVATPPAPEGEPPVVGGGGAAAPPAPDRVGMRLSKVCRAVQAELKDAPEPTEPKGAATNAQREREVLRELRKQLANFDIDTQRKAALAQYLAVLNHEIEVDELIVTAGKSEDQPAVDDLNEQNGHNRAKRRQLALDDLEANGCRPGTRITD